PAADPHTPPLHDALPIFGGGAVQEREAQAPGQDVVGGAGELAVADVDDLGLDVGVSRRQPLAEAVPRQPRDGLGPVAVGPVEVQDRKSTRLNSSHVKSSY